MGSARVLWGLPIRPWDLDMKTIALSRPGRPADMILRLVCAGAMSALVFALSADVRQFEGEKECGGASFATASLCAAATLLLGGSAVIAESVFRFRSI